MKSYRAEYTWTVEQLIDATWMHARNSSFRIFEWVVFLMGIICLASGIAVWYSDLKGITVPLIMLGLYVLFLRKPIQNWQIRRQFKRRKDKGITISFEFAEDEVKVQSAQSKGSFGWDQYPKAVEGKKGLVLYQPFNRYHWIPASAFDDTGEWEGFRELAKKKIADFKIGR